MANCYCQKCHKTLKDTQFYTYRDGSKVELCKNCLTLHVNNFKPDTFLWILEKMDVPYVPTAWNVLRDRDYAKDHTKVGGSAVLGKYLGKMRLNQFKDKRWADSAELQKEEEEKMKEHAEQVKEQEKWAIEQYQAGNINESEYRTLTSSLTQELKQSEMQNSPLPTPPPMISTPTGYGVGPDGTAVGYNVMFNENYYMPEEDIPDPSLELTNDDRKYLVMKWGRSYQPREWVELEKMYTEMDNSFDIQDADTINTLVLICKLNLKANQALDSGDYDGFAKLSRSLESMRKSAKFTAAQKKEEAADVVDCVGELVSMCERQGFIPRFATDIPQDKVDITLKDMNDYVRKLVTQDLGFGQQIEDALRKIQIQKEMQEQEAVLADDEENEVNDKDYQDYFAEIEAQKQKDLETIEEALVEEDE